MTIETYLSTKAVRGTWHGTCSFLYAACLRSAGRVLSARLAGSLPSWLVLRVTVPSSDPWPRP